MYTLTMNGMNPLWKVVIFQQHLFVSLMQCWFTNIIKYCIISHFYELVYPIGMVNINYIDSLFPIGYPLWPGRPLHA